MPIVRSPAAALLLAFVMLCPGSGAATPQRVTGTKVSIEPPPGFQFAPALPGFVQTDSGASIVVNEIPGPVKQLKAGMTEEQLGAQGMMLLESRTTAVGEHSALLLHAMQVAGTTQFEKWILIFGNESASVLLVASYPQGVIPDPGPALKGAILSASWNPDQKLDPLEGLPFRITPAGSLQIGERVSSMIVLTRGGVRTPVPPEEPMLVVGASFSEVRIDDLEAFSRQRITRTPEITDLSDLRGRPTKVNGMPAWELTARAKDAKTGTPIHVYQLLVAEQTSYFLAQGLVGSSQAEEFLPQFRAVGQSLTPAP